jgi:hypothetical protein
MLSLFCGFFLVFKIGRVFGFPVLFANMDHFSPFGSMFPGCPGFRDGVSPVANFLFVFLDSSAHWFVFLMMQR